MITGGLPGIGASLVSQKEIERDRGKPLSKWVQYIFTREVCIHFKSKFEPANICAGTSGTSWSSTGCTRWTRRRRRPWRPRPLRRRLSRRNRGNNSRAIGGKMKTVMEEETNICYCSCSTVSKRLMGLGCRQQLCDLEHSVERQLNPASSPLTREATDR